MSHEGLLWLLRVQCLGKYAYRPSGDNFSFFFFFGAVFFIIARSGRRKRNAWTIWHQIMPLVP